MDNGLFALIGRGSRAGIALSLVLTIGCVEQSPLTLQHNPESDVAALTDGQSPNTRPTITYAGLPDMTVAGDTAFPFSIFVYDFNSTASPTLDKRPLAVLLDGKENPLVNSADAVTCPSAGHEVSGGLWRFDCTFNPKDLKPANLGTAAVVLHTAFTFEAINDKTGATSIPTTSQKLSIKFQTDDGKS
jgi:hypothetical protein